MWQLISPKAVYKRCHEYESGFESLHFRHGDASLTFPTSPTSSTSLTFLTSLTILTSFLVRKNKVAPGARSRPTQRSTPAT